MPNNTDNGSADTTTNAPLNFVRHYYENNWLPNEELNFYLTLLEIERLLDDTEFQALLINDFQFNFYAKLLMKQSFMLLNTDKPVATFEKLKGLLDYYWDHGVSETRALLISVLLSEPFKEKHWLSKEDLEGIFTGRITQDLDCAGRAYLLWQGYKEFR